MAWCFSTRASVARVLCHTHAFTVIYGLRYHGLPEWEKLLLCMYSEYLVMVTCKFVEVLQYIHDFMKTLLNKLLCCQWFELILKRHTVKWYKYLTFDTFHKQHQILYAVWYFTYLLPYVCVTHKHHDLPAHSHDEWMCALVLTFLLLSLCVGMIYVVDNTICVAIFPG